MKGSCGCGGSIVMDDGQCGFTQDGEGHGRDGFYRYDKGGAFLNNSGKMSSRVPFFSCSTFGKIIRFNLWAERGKTYVRS